MKRLLMIWMGIGGLCFSLRAQSSDSFLSPSERFYNVRMKTSSLGVGGLVLKDEYLSPLNYGGFSVQYSQESTQLRYKSSVQGVSIWSHLFGNVDRTPSSSWIGQRHFVVSLSQTKNPAQNGSISRLEARLSGSRQYALLRAASGVFYLGPGYTVSSGGMYSSRNGNNPATFKLEGLLTLAMSYAYRLPIRSCPILLRLSSRTDLLGLRWEQQFGESYYELYYLSDALTKRLSFAHLGNSFGQELRLNVDIPILDRLICSLGYRYQHKSWQINHLYNKVNEHSVNLGFTRYFRPLGGRSWLKNNVEVLPF